MIKTFSSAEILETFTRDGVVVLPQFCTPEEVAKMKGRMAELIDAWDPKEAKVGSGDA